jgi:hypothetical protein
MLAVMSPAKKLDATRIPTDLPTTEPVFIEHARELIEVARALPAADVAALMDLSAKLANLNVERYRDWTEDHRDGLPAIYQFAGDTYQGFDVRSLPPDAVAWAQDHVAILSGLYGVLRPLDRIHPYRLEMGSRLKNPRGPDLYTFWGTRPAERLAHLLQDHADPTLLDCASTEYFQVVDQKVLGRRVITPVFQDIPPGGGKPKIISFYAKRARGALARWVVQHRVENSEHIKQAEPLGYRWDAGASEGDQWVFRRVQPPTLGKSKLADAEDADPEDQA